jgi:hypothetical protein
VPVAEEQILLVAGKADALHVVVMVRVLLLVVAVALLLVVREKVLDMEV